MKRENRDSSVGRTVPRATTAGGRSVPEGRDARAGCYVRRSGIIETDLGQELILLDPGTQQMFSLNATGRLIWMALDDGSVEAIVPRIAAAFDVDHETAADDLRALLRALLEAGLVVAAG